MSSFKKYSPINRSKNSENSTISRRQMSISQIDSGEQRGRLSNRETLSKYADFTKSDIIKSQKHPKPRVRGETTLTQKYQIPILNDSKKNNKKSLIMGSKQVPTSQIGTVGGKYRLSTREVPSQYADFIK